MERGCNDQLTRREREVAALTIQGLRNLEIARRLGVTESAVKYHLSNIYSKLGVNNRTRLVSVYSTLAIPAEEAR